MAYVVSAEPRIAVNTIEAENLFIEWTGALERVDIKHSFQDAEERRHFVPQLGPRLARVSQLSRSYPATGTISRSGIATSRLTAFAATTARCCA